MNEFQTFLEKYPSYTKTESIDELRKTDYVRLDYGEHVYLDYTGGGIYAESQIEKHHQLLHNNVFGNPHSTRNRRGDLTSSGAVELRGAPCTRSHSGGASTKLDLEYA